MDETEGGDPVSHGNYCKDRKTKLKDMVIDGIL